MTTWTQRAAAEYGRRVLERAAAFPLEAGEAVESVRVDLEGGLVVWVVRSADGFAWERAVRLGPATLRRELRRAVRRAR